MPDLSHSFFFKGLQKFVQGWTFKYVDKLGNCGKMMLSKFCIAVVLIFKYVLLILSDRPSYTVVTYL